MNCGVGCGGVVLVTVGSMAPGKMRSHWGDEPVETAAWNGAGRDIGECGRLGLGYLIGVSSGMFKDFF